MKRLTLAGNRRLKAVVPALTGGLDLSRPSWLIDDTALSDGRDMWWQNGALRTRPGFSTATDRGYTHASGAVTRTVCDRTGTVVELTRTETLLTVTTHPAEGGAASVLFSRALEAEDTYCILPVGPELTPFTLLLLISDGGIWGIAPGDGIVQTMSYRVYEPTLMVDGVPTADRTNTAANGRMVEPKNRLSDRFRCEFTTDGSGLYYFLPLKNLTGAFVVQVTHSDGTTTQYAVSEGETTATDANGITLYVNLTGGFFYFRQGSTILPLPDEGLCNNLKVFAGQPLSGPSPCAMTFGYWYGGDSTGGSRLFLGGSPGYPHTVLYSAPGNPLYFPQTASAAVGDPGQALTAFGEQDGVLVLFKGSALYTAEAVTDQSLTVVSLNAAVGCDRPETVALYEDRLTWACADGAVYRLTALTPLTARGITRVDRPVAPLLTGAAIRAAAVCGDVYYLLTDTDLLVLTDSETPVWYRFGWHDPGSRPDTLLNCRAHLLLAAESDTCRWWFTLDGTQDTLTGTTLSTQPVCGTVCTKAYDFGTPDTGKQVLGVAAEVSGPVQPAYVTESRLYRDRTHHPDRGGLVWLTPNIPRCRRLAVQLTGENLTVGSVVLHLKGDLRSR